MAASLVARVNLALQRVEYLIGNLLGRRYPPEALCIVGLESHKRANLEPKFSLKDILGDGILWAVPKHRRSLEKRQKRRFGHPDYVLKIMLPKTNLRTCNTCGDDYEAGVLCPTCYKKVMDETKEIQEAIQTELKLEPVETEVAVLYEGEKNQLGEVHDNKRIVELKKPRPAWFSKNLLQETTQQPATTSDVKPSELG